MHMQSRNRRQKNRKQVRRFAGSACMGMLILVGAFGLAGCGAQQAVTNAYIYPESLQGAFVFAPKLYQSQQESCEEIQVNSGTNVLPTEQQAVQIEETDDVQLAFAEEEERDVAQEQTDAPENVHTQQAEELPVHPAANSETHQTRNKWADLIALYRAGEVTFEQLVYAGMSVEELYSAGLISLQDMLDAGLITEEGILEAGLSLPTENPQAEQNTDQQTEQVPVEQTNTEDTQNTDVRETEIVPQISETQELPVEIVVPEQQTIEELPNTETSQIPDLPDGDEEGTEGMRHDG